jgi:hypothetical protein
VSVGSNATILDALLKLGAGIGEPCSIEFPKGDWPALCVDDVQVCTATGTDFDVWADMDTPIRFGLTFGEAIAFVKGSVDR